MLEEFSYLPKEKAEEIVITNTRRVAEQCEVIEPLAEEWKSYNPKIAGADAMRKRWNFMENRCRKSSGTGLIWS